jgi:hypothetical protein
MRLLKIIKAAIDAHSDADGLVNGVIGCGCHQDDLAPCSSPSLENCQLARSETLTEPRGECGIGDLWFTAIENDEFK